MAVVHNYDGTQRRGKMNKKSKEVHRVRNGKEHVYYLNNDCSNPPSEAQKLQRSVFGRTNAIVNAIIADPQQEKEWRQRMMEHNRQSRPDFDPTQVRYKTLRSFLYAVFSEKISSKPSARRRRAKLPYTLPKSVRLQIKPFSDLSASELYEILKARFSVFVGEQNITYLDEDNIDYNAIHLSLRRNGRVIAYARLYPTTETNVWQLGRLLTIDRGKGFGRYIVLQAIEKAKTHRALTLRLHAQVQTVLFYEKLGFKTVGDIFYEADIPHVCMEIKI